MLPTPLMVPLPLVCARRRCSVGTVRDDIELGLLAYGFLGEAPAALIELRRRCSPGSSHDDPLLLAREIADRVDGEWLRQPIASARVAIQADWKAALVDGES